MAALRAESRSRVDRIALVKMFIMAIGRGVRYTVAGTRGH